MPQWDEPGCHGHAANWTALKYARCKAAKLTESMDERCDARKSDGRAWQIGPCRPKAGGAPMNPSPPVTRTLHPLISDKTMVAGGGPPGTEAYGLSAGA